MDYVTIAVIAASFLLGAAAVYPWLEIKDKTIRELEARLADSQDAEQDMSHAAQIIVDAERDLDSADVEQLLRGPSDPEGPPTGGASA